MDIAIEQANVADLSALLDLTMEHARLNEGFDQDYYALAANAESEYRESLRATLRDSNQAVFVAKAGEEIVGCIQADLRRITIFKLSERGLIYNLYMKRMWRRRGIGKKLLDVASDWLKRKGAAIIFLNVASQNVEAHDFYERLGFKTVNFNMYKLP